MFWILSCKNASVTDYYLSIIELAVKKITGSVLKTNNINEVLKGSKDDCYFVATVLDAIKLYVKGKKNIFIWIQGVLPEESYMRHKNVFRKIILEKIEKYALKQAKMVFFISQAMKNHYEKKYRINFTNKCYIMPCYNAQIQKDSFFRKGKYDRNIFTYVGSLSIWQKFDEVVRCYKSIEDLNFPNTKLLVLTPEIQKAKNILENFNIQNYLVDYVEGEEFYKVLSDVKFGFIIRDDVVVNQVSTPTKISSYLSCGIIPIYSTCLEDFHSVAKNMNYVLPYDLNFYKKLRSLVQENIDAGKIYNEYANLFITYYNKDSHISNIVPIIKKIYKEIKSE